MTRLLCRCRDGGGDGGGGGYSIPNHQMIYGRTGLGYVHLQYPGLKQRVQTREDKKTNTLGTWDRYPKVHMILFIIK